MPLKTFADMKTAVRFAEDKGPEGDEEYAKNVIKGLKKCQKEIDDFIDEQEDVDCSIECRLIQEGETFKIRDASLICGDDEVPIVVLNKYKKPVLPD